MAAPAIVRAGSLMPVKAMPVEVMEEYALQHATGHTYRVYVEGHSITLGGFYERTPRQYLGTITLNPTTSSTRLEALLSDPKVRLENDPKA